jgi:tetratricopeptide (TPR) repeat protein
VRTRLDSWKQIAAYLERHIATVRRWEKCEGLPIHRHMHTKLGSVYAYASELDAWFDGRRSDCTGPSRGPASRAGRALSARLPPPPPIAAMPAWPVDIVGRDVELRRLAEVWREACRRRRQLVFIVGDAGAGKSRLAFEFARSVAAEATLLLGQSDGDAVTPFAPFVAILQWLVRATPPRRLRKYLAGIGGSIELARLVPEIAKLISAGPEASVAAADGQRFRMFEAFAGLLRETSGGAPLLLLVEDAHRADRDSLQLLRHLSWSLADAAICIVVTWREAEAGAASRDILDDLRRDLSAVRIALGGLAEDAVHRFVASWLRRDSPPSLPRFLGRLTDGNPMFIGEMLRHLEEAGRLGLAIETPSTVAELGLPESIRELIGRRLSRLSEASHHLLALASVLGREFDLSVVEILTELPEALLLDAIDEAVAARIIVEDGRTPGRFSFTHTLIREALYSGLTPSRRVRLHHQVGEALERQCHARRGVIIDLAYHFGQAAVYRGAEKAIGYAVQAGDHAAGSLAFEEAARYYELALHTLDSPRFGSEVDETRFDLHIRRARCLSQVGQWASAKSGLETALGLLSPEDVVRRCEVALRLAETSFWLTDVAAVRRFGDEARAQADGIGRDDLAADALAWIASAAVADGDVQRGMEIDRQALARARDVRSFALARIPLTLYWAGQTGEAIERAAKMVERARESEDPALRLYALSHWGLSLSGAGRYDEALRAFDEAHTLGRRCGALPLLARATSMSAAPLLGLGDLAGATTRALEARDLARRVGFEPPVVSAGIDLLLIFARSQNPGRADSLLEEMAGAVAHAAGWHKWKWQLRLWQARAELAMARGNPADAIVAAQNVVEQSRLRSRPKYEALGLAVRARARHRLGLRQAVTDARAAVSVARRLADPAVLLECLRLVLDVDGSDDSLTEARRTVTRILEQLSEENLRRAFLMAVDSRISPVGSSQKPAAAAS